MNGILKGSVVPADNVPAGRSSSIPADYVSAGHVLVPADTREQSPKGLGKDAKPNTKWFILRLQGKFGMASQGLYGRGNGKSKKMKKTMLKQQLSRIHCDRREGLHKGYVQIFRRSEIGRVMGVKVAAASHSFSFIGTACFWLKATYILSAAIAQSVSQVPSGRLITNGMCSAFTVAENDKKQDISMKTLTMFEKEGAGQKMNTTIEQPARFAQKKILDITNESSIGTFCYMVTDGCNFHADGADASGSAA
ncbi:hypothetical protein Tco_0976279 [Tanacetum coccineum]|uniref:Uncharacterized protein n=1 Tax=Tanacetum coccineum TaxID=301880 RepID=A0ABQ5EH83_9ASTR